MDLPVKFFSHGTAAFGIYLASLAALLFIVPPSYPLELNTPGIDPAQEFFIDFFGGWVFRMDLLANIIFIAILTSILLLTSTLCSRTSNVAIIASTEFLGAFFFLYFSNKYAPTFLNAYLQVILPAILINGSILIAMAAIWSTFISKRYNPAIVSSQNRCVTIETICPQCGKSFMSIPKFCAYCSFQLRQD